MANQITQIDNSDPYLYNFNTEVRLILEAVVARTVEESLRESLTEEEDRMTRSVSGEKETFKCKQLWQEDFQDPRGRNVIIENIWRLTLNCYTRHPDTMRANIKSQNFKTLLVWTDILKIFIFTFIYLNI